MFQSTLGRIGLLIAVVGGSGVLPVSVGHTESVAIPAGQVSLLYPASREDDSAEKSRAESQLLEVAAFEIDKYPVTNSEFLSFTERHPEWQRSAVKSIFADKLYLSHWVDDTHLGQLSLPQSPVVNVSWFAAKRYCEERQMSLPTVAQWEYVLAASDTELDASDDPEHQQRILSSYQRPTPAVFPSVESAPVNAFGVAVMHGVVWEWVLDFNTALVTADLRSSSDVDQQMFCGSAAIGASDFSDYAAFLRYAMRGSLSGNYATGSLGFRCVRNHEEEHT